MNDANQKLSEDFIQEFKDNVYWDLISKHQKLSENFIRTFQDKIDWSKLLHNQNQKYYSIKFIQDFAPEMNYYYKFHTYSRRIQRWWKDIYYRPQGKGFKKCKNEFERLI